MVTALSKTRMLGYATGAVGLLILGPVLVGLRVFDLLAKVKGWRVTSVALAGWSLKVEIGLDPLAFVIVHVYWMPLVVGAVLLCCSWILLNARPAKQLLTTDRPA